MKEPIPTGSLGAVLQAYNNVLASKQREIDVFAQGVNDTMKWLSYFPEQKELNQAKLKMEAEEARASRIADRQEELQTLQLDREKRYGAKLQEAQIAQAKAQAQNLAANAQNLKANAYATNVATQQNKDEQDYLKKARAKTPIKTLPSPDNALIQAGAQASARIDKNKIGSQISGQPINYSKSVR